MDKEKKVLSEEELEQAAGGRISINRNCDYFEPKSNDPVAAYTKGCPNCAHYKSGFGGLYDGSCELGQ